MVPQIIRQGTHQGAIWRHVVVASLQGAEDTCNGARDPALPVIRQGTEQGAIICEWVVASLQFRLPAATETVRATSASRHPSKSRPKID